MPWLGSDATRKLDGLTLYWEQIRNAALGRTTTPIVSTALAEDVANAHARYLQWRETLEGYLFTPSIEDDIREWRRVGDEYAAKIRAEGKKAPTLEGWAAPTDIVGELKGLAGCIAIAGFAWYLATRRKG